MGSGRASFRRGLKASNWLAVLGIAAEASATRIADKIRIVQHAKNNIDIFYIKKGRIFAKRHINIKTK